PRALWSARSPATRERAPRSEPGPASWPAGAKPRERRSRRKRTRTSRRSRPRRTRRRRSRRSRRHSASASKPRTTWSSTGARRGRAGGGLCGPEAAQPTMPRRLRRALLGLVAAVLAAELLYLLAANTYLNTNLIFAAVNRNPAKFSIRWGGAWTLW